MSSKGSVSFDVRYFVVFTAKDPNVNKTHVCCSYMFRLQTSNHWPRCKKIICNNHVTIRCISAQLACFKPKHVATIQSKIICSIRRFVLADVPLYLTLKNSYQ